MALGLALFALVILGAVVSCAFVVSRYNHSGASNSGYATEAQATSEAGLAAMYANWDPTVHSVMPIWDGTSATVWSSGTTAVGGNSQLLYVDSVKRLNSQLFLVEAIGRRMNQGGTAVLGVLKTAQLVRLVKPTIGINAAVTVQDPLTMNGNSFFISGINAFPDQWGSGECPALDPGNSDDVVGIRSAVATGMGPSDDNNLDGFPADEAPNDPTITDATFQGYLDYTYDTLAGLAGVKVLASNNTYTNIGPALDASTGTCDKATDDASGTYSGTISLGEPWRNPPSSGAVPQCYSYFPVVHGTGSIQTKFGGGGGGASARGQGTLLVDNDFEITGGFEWVGLIIVKGKIKINGTGNKITGAILAQGVDLASSGAVSGNVEIQYSSCAIQQAIGGATMARPLGTRNWMQAY